MEVHMPLSINDTKKIDETVITPLLQEVQGLIAPEDDQSTNQKAAMIWHRLETAYHIIIDDDKNSFDQIPKTHESIVERAKHTSIDSETTINFLEFYTNLDGKIEILFPQATVTEVQTYIRIQLFNAVDPLPHFMRLQKQFLAITNHHNIKIDNKNTVESLPSDMLKLAFSFLGLLDCMACYATSRKFNYAILDILNQKTTEVYYVLGNVFTHSKTYFAAPGRYFRKEISDRELKRAFVFQDSEDENICKKGLADDEDEKESESTVYLFDNIYATIEYLNHLTYKEMKFYDNSGYFLVLKQYVLLAVMHKHLGSNQLNWKKKEIAIDRSNGYTISSPNAPTLDIKFAKAKKDDLLLFKGIATVEKQFGIFKTFGVLDKTKPVGIIENTAKGTTTEIDSTCIIS